MNQIDAETLEILKLEADNVHAGVQKSLCTTGLAEDIRDRHKVYMSFMVKFNEEFDEKLAISDEFNIDVRIIMAILNNKIYRIK